jgi:6-phosphogluconolactonase
MAIRSPGPSRALAFALLLLPAPLLGGDPPPGPDKGPGGSEAPKKLRLYVGTYTGPRSKGIYSLDFDPATGKLSGRALAAATANPSFLAIHPTGRFLYAVNEISDLGGKKTGAVAAFAVDQKTGALTLLNRRPSRGAGPCHLVVDARGKYVLAANYGGGSACVLPVGKDGKLGEATGFVQHKGSSVDRARQEGPHAHSINLDRANAFAFVADLGLDKVMIYKFDRDKGTLTPNEPDSVKVKPGSGPRHFAFHPSGRYAYVINELANTVTAFRYDAGRGRLETLQTVSTLPKGFKGKSYTAEVVVHPSGKFLYGSNRGHDSIAVFRVDTKSGKLTPAGHQGTDVKTPRNFIVDPAGKFLLVANQDAGSVIVFSIHPTTGALSPTGHSAEVPSPVCLRLTPAPEGK